MFRYFPTNYVWDLSVNLAIEMGARIGEIEEMCGPLQEAARQPDAEGTRAFREAWVTKADRLCELAVEDEARGRTLSAGEKYRRASVYLITAERMLAHDAPGRIELYRRSLDTFDKSVALRGDNCERVRIPYGDAHLSGLLVKAPNAGARSPLLVQVNGLDSTKEMKYFVGLPAWLAARGVSSLIVDQPGTGEALRLHGMHAMYNTEAWASRIVDWLETRDDVDPKRIGMEGVSLGGYYCPRAVAFEPRFACGVVWGANHDWRDVQKKRLQREGNFPVPHYWKHVCWVWGAQDIDDFMRIAENVHLDGVLDRIKVPFLVTQSAAFAPYAAATSVFAAVMIFTHTFAFGMLARIDSTGRAVAATPAMLMTGAAIGPVLGGTLVKQSGYGSLGMAAILIAAAAVFCFSRLERRPHSAGV